MVVAYQDIIRQIETLSFKALPALETRYYDGWLIRYANGYTKRANSVNPVYASHEDTDLKISRCEAFYTRKKLPTIFKMTDNIYPQELDAILESKQYQKASETGVYTLPLERRGSLAADVNIKSKLTDQWLTTFIKMNHIDEEKHKTLKQMFNLIPTRCGFLRLMDGNTVVGVALGVIDKNWMGIFDVAVHQDHRGKGHGRTIMDALLNWGMTQQADTAYLQLQCDNAVAKNLYMSLGFTEQYRYWYRVKDFT